MDAIGIIDTELKKKSGLESEFWKLYEIIAHPPPPTAKPLAPWRCHAMSTIDTMAQVVTTTTTTTTTTT